jgi:hypothetical protein
LQPRRDHLGVIHHQRVARLQQLRQLAHAAVFHFGLAARPHQQQPRGVARRDRPQGDPLRRQVEIEQVGAHGS